MDQNDEESVNGMLGTESHIILRNPAFSSREKVTLKKIRAFPLEEDFRSAFDRERNERGITDVECYQRAQIDRRLFWSIFHRAGYKPKKRTAIALILTLKPDLRLMDDLLNRLGYCLTHSDRADVVIEACLSKKIFRIEDVNSILSSMELPVLGSKLD